MILVSLLTNLAILKAVTFVLWILTNALPVKGGSQFVDCLSSDAFYNTTC
jgi:hypothetical protein